jgi:4-hydroxy-tetrahydrodipicolinate synthase
MTKIKGMFANLPTPFTACGQAIDLERMASHIDWLLDCGIHDLSTQLSAGEFAYQTVDERKSLTSCVRGRD